ncbi:MAG: energy-coupling factor transporter transmembrane protein EcfT [Lachnospiraceae bacterium]|nr:energy-coupling factor transporter transmembrane protein EcfT [Lachnospiraceae bacterium]MBP5183876.1 energy-coupling factor transporter transmembrane protein EcfT [Lachnospiraceae bacterium]
MIRDITLGQYYPENSIIHRLDPRVKIVGTLVYLVSLFLFKSFWGYIPTMIFLFSCIHLSKVPFKHIVKGLKAVVMLLMFTLICNIIFTRGEVPLFEWKFIRIYPEGLRTAGFMGIRLTLLITGSSLMTFTTTPTQLTDGLERLFAPLKLFKVPVHEVAMMMSIALRFIPVLLEETDKIMKAQQARGADFEEGNIFQRAKAMVPILVPLFISSFRRAGDLAMAMEVRCYHGGEGRTRMKPLKYKGRDFIAYGVQLLYLAALILVRIFLG